jgi:hypothetical protein
VAGNVTSGIGPTLPAGGGGHIHHAGSSGLSGSDQQPTPVARTTSGLASLPALKLAAEGGAVTLAGVPWAWAY